MQLRSLLKTLPLLIGVFILTISLPIVAQDPISTPTNSTVIRDVSEAAQTLGVLNVVLLFVVAVLALIVVFFVIAAYRLGIPLIQQVQKASAARDDLQETLIHRIEKDETKESAAQALRTRQAEALDTVGSRMVDLNDSINNGRDAIIKSVRESASDTQKVVNAHTDDAAKTINGNFDTVILELQRVSSGMAELVTKEQLDGKLKPLMERINRVIVEIERRKGCKDEAAPPDKPPEPPTLVPPNAE